MGQQTKIVWEKLQFRSCTVVFFCLARKKEFIQFSINTKSWPFTSQLKPQDNRPSPHQSQIRRQDGLTLFDIAIACLTNYLLPFVRFETSDVGPSGWDRDTIGTITRHCTINKISKVLFYMMLLWILCDSMLWDSKVQTFPTRVSTVLSICSYSGADLYGSNCKAFSSNMPPKWQLTHLWRMCTRGITIKLSLPCGQLYW